MNFNFPDLEELVGGYFHQDWKEDASTAAGVLERYLSEWPIESVSKTLDELIALLQENDERLASTVMSMGSYYNPVGDGLTYREWLNQIAARLTKHLAL